VPSKLGQWRGIQGQQTIKYRVRRPAPKVRACPLLKLCLFQFSSGRDEAQTEKQTMKNRIYATKRIAALRTPAKNSDFIPSVNKLEPGPVVLYLRVSAPTQKDNLPPQRTNCKAAVDKRGCSVVEIIEEIASGWLEERIGFERAILAARAAGATIVAESVDRFKRSWPKRNAPLSVFDMNRLMAEAVGVRLATVVHPDTPPNEVRSYQSKRGQAGKGNYGGRPKAEYPKKARRLRLSPEAIAFRHEGKSYRQIGALLNVSWSTVRDWLKREKTAHPQFRADHEESP